jgi:hypothetical protein
VRIIDELKIREKALERKLAEHQALLHYVKKSVAQDALDWKLLSAGTTAFDKLLAEAEQKGRDELMAELKKQEPVAWMNPSDLENFKKSECFAQAFSIQVGRSGEDSMPLFTDQLLLQSDRFQGNDDN